MADMLKKLEEVRKDIAGRLSDIWTQNSLIESRMVSIQRYLQEHADRTEDTRLREKAAQIAVESLQGSGYIDRESALTERMNTVYDFLSGPTDAVLTSKKELEDLRAMAAKFEELNGVKPDTVGVPPTIGKCSAESELDYADMTRIGTGLCVLETEHPGRHEDMHGNKWSTSR